MRRFGGTPAFTSRARRLLRADITVTEHLLLHQKRSPQATGQFTGLLYDLILSGKTISRRINKAGLLDILGGTGEVNEPL